MVGGEGAWPKKPYVCFESEVGLGRAKDDYVSVISMAPNGPVKTFFA